MRHYLMPKKIERGDRVIIWGCGTMGRQLLSMSKKYGVEVIKILDREADLSPKLNHIMLTELPSALKSVQPEEYDYIVVAVADKKMQEEIVSIIESWNIDMNKVIVGADYYDDVVTLDDPEARANCMVHFSWHGEDMIVANIFFKLGIKNPSYLDVGCNAPFLGSNTAYFYLTGSKGVCIDANPEMIEKMREKRQDDISVCVGVVPVEGEGKKLFHVLEMDGLSTFKEEYVQHYHDSHSMEYSQAGSRRIEVETHSLPYIVENYCNGIWPDFLDIDIEGFDDEVIQGTLFPQDGPKVICIETHDETSRKHLIEQGYTLYTYTSHNDIWIRNDYAK